MTVRYNSARSFGWVVAAGFAFGACASRPPQALKDARSAYQEAEQGPAAQYGPAQLHTAKQALKLAEQTYEDEGDTAATRDRAYVAMRKAELATVEANIDATRRG
jgi:hypothetical protein